MADAPRQDRGADDAHDRRLMARLAAGDQQALATLVERHWPAVFRMAWRVAHHQQDAEDLAQETFIRLWHAAATYQPQARLTTFLYRILTNLYLDQRRRRRPAEMLQSSSPRPAEPHDGPDTRLIHAEETARVQQAVAALPERQRVALVLHRFEGLSLAEIAQATGWSGSAIESLLVRAYANLRQSLAERNRPEI